LGAANLPPAFSDTFTSRFVDTGGLRQHVVIGGDGPPLLLVHGWPQTWSEGIGASGSTILGGVSCPLRAQSVPKGHRGRSR
jgi:hypothetical protein